MPDEVVVADDGSGPDTAEIVRAYASRADFPMHHVWHHDKGFRAAKIRNEAIKKSSSEYIVLLDGDCIPHKRFVEDHISIAERGFFVQGKRVILGTKASETITASEVNSLPRMTAYFIQGEVGNAHHIFRMPFFPACKNTKLSGIKSCNMGFFREDLLAVDGFNEAFVGWGREDSELAVRLFKYGLKRKDHPFMAICFHLWHKENARDSLLANDMILETAIKSDGYTWKQEIVKKSDG